MKSMTNFETREYKNLPRGAREFVVKDYITDWEGSFIGEVPVLVQYLRGLLSHAHAEEGDIKWEGRDGNTFYCGALAEKAISDEIAALESGTHWSQTDTDWRSDMAEALK